MTMTMAKYEDGRVILDTPVDWPNGSELEIRLRSPLSNQCDDETPETPEEIEQWIEEMKSIPGIQISDEEMAAWHLRRKEDKERELNRMHARVDRLIENAK